ncbi:PQQ-dependent sugar dehydrogenase [Alteraurantiacibacter palmitatis]|uniref:PQQ-dependent sugar dehydrogenase n=1 Tax=Alteraurantiacibacter palmitatis TaxID=2054628 RepID=A0ABV7E416_9SPHN
MGRGRIAALAAIALIALPASAQTPPPGIPVPPLSDAPYVFATAEVPQITVQVVVRGFARPFAFAFLPDGDLLVAERSGHLRLIRAATSNQPQLDPQPIEGMPQPGTTQGSFGLHDVALHPDFAQNRLVYWTWNIPVPRSDGEPPNQGRFSIMRGRLEGGRLSGVETVFAVEEAGYAGGTRIAFAPDGTLLATTSAPFGAEGQDMASPYGKVLRLHADGSVPGDNPFAGQPGAHPAIYSLGHRDQHGLMVLSTGEVFSAEHGPNGGDELNRVTAGANYGWPLVSLGRNYDGTALPDARWQADGMTDPLVAWLPSIAPSGLLHYTGNAFPAWKGSVFIGSGRRGNVGGTGGLERLVFNAQWQELRRETLLGDLRQRVRDVAQGPDGLIYVLTDGPAMAVLRVAG